MSILHVLCKKYSVTSKKWSGKVPTKWAPPENMFKQSAEKLASTLKQNSDDLKQAMSRLTFYINRAGSNLSKEDKSRLENAKDKLRALYTITASTIKNVVYHGTDYKFKTFDKTKRELGFHFGETIEQAKARGKYVMRVRLNLKHPYDIVSDLGQWDDMEMLEEHLGEANEGPFTEDEFDLFKNVDDVRKALKKKGYDGIIYMNSFEGGDADKESYIVFEPQQIKFLGYEK